VNIPENMAWLPLKNNWRNIQPSCDLNVKDDYYSFHFIPNPGNYKGENSMALMIFPIILLSRIYDGVCWLCTGYSKNREAIPSAIEPGVIVQISNIVEGVCGEYIKGMPASAIPFCSMSLCSLI
jgi:hypothetical protein